MSVVRLIPDHAYLIANFDEEEFAKFYADVLTAAISTGDIFTAWDSAITDINVKLDVDPTINLACFYEKLATTQDKKNDVVEIMTKALSFKADWEAYVSAAERYVRKLKAQLVKDAEVKALKNKELQEAKMYDLRADVFDCQHYCQTTLTLVKTMISAFDKKLDLIDSANLNINRQITVTELLTYKGLI